jgi:deoxyribodipyrimidine photo-lyase
MARLHWFRKDLRLGDNAALADCVEAAVADGDAEVTALYVFDSDAFHALAGIRQHSLRAGVAALSESLKSHGAVLNVRTADRGLTGLAEAVVAVARAAGAKEVHAMRLFDPAGVAEQNAVGLALQAAGVFLRLTGSNYAVAPGTVLKASDGLPYRVYTPFFRAWLEHLSTGADAQPKPMPQLGQLWRSPQLEHAQSKPGMPDCSESAPFEVKAGEAFALRTFERFRQRALADYADKRNRADLSGTSHLSHALAHGEVHPRTLLAQLGDSEGEEVFRKELAWREFYADVLWNNPHSQTEYYSPVFANMRYDSGDQADARLKAWQSGNTGYPMVDAGKRQLLADGWVHNRVRMIVASFLVKDLHLEWQQGAAWFERNLSDFDPASNAHGWQWTAGTGTDASPYYRVFNPVMQGLKFDPNGDYVRKYVPELRHLAGASAHEPWDAPAGYTAGYAQRIVDHGIERLESLSRLEELKSFR